VYECVCLCFFQRPKTDLWTSTEEIRLLLSVSVCVRIYLFVWLLACVCVCMLACAIFLPLCHYVAHRVLMFLTAFEYLPGSGRAPRASDYCPAVINA
jgi:hypothetical protein